MTKTCGKCGHPVPDDRAQFCNRCGAVVPDERKPPFPICPGCGTVVSDELAQFCNRCGAKIPPVPIICSTCGNPALDNQSRFCTRCGTTFEQKPLIRSSTCPVCGAPDPQGQSLFCNRCGSPFNRPGVTAHNPEQVPVIITQRKPGGTLPPVIVPDTDWEPWNDVPPDSGTSGIHDPSPPEQIPHQDKQVAVPPKRYAHLPLVADELKTKGEPASGRHVPDTPVLSHKRRGTEKKGILGFLKK